MLPKKSKLNSCQLNADQHYTYVCYMNTICDIINKYNNHNHSRIL